MKLALEGKGAAELVRLAREGVRAREKVLWRLMQSKLSENLDAAVRRSDNAIYETEKAIGEFWQGNESPLQNALEIQAEAFINLDKKGWATLEFMSEGSRYEPHWVWTDGRYQYRFYNPATGNYDVAIDRGWTLSHLPNRRRKSCK